MTVMRASHAAQGVARPKGPPHMALERAVGAPGAARALGACYAIGEARAP